MKIVRRIWRWMSAPWKALKLVKSIPMPAAFQFAADGRLLGLRIEQRDQRGIATGRMALAVNHRGQKGDGVGVTLTLVAALEGHEESEYDVMLLPAAFVNALREEVAMITTGSWPKVET